MSEHRPFWTQWPYLAEAVTQAPIEAPEDRFAPLRKVSLLTLWIQACLLIWGINLLPFPVLHLYTWITQALGGVIMLSAFVLWFLAVSAHRQNGGDIRPFALGGLITQGPYCHIQNPLFIAASAFLFGHSLVVGGSLLGFGVVLLWLVWIHFLYVLPQEKLHLDYHGEAYLRYQKHTKRWF